MSHWFTSHVYIYIYLYLYMYIPWQISLVLIGIPQHPSTRLLWSLNSWVCSHQDSAWFAKNTVPCGTDGPGHCAYSTSQNRENICHQDSILFNSAAKNPHFDSQILTSTSHEKSSVCLNQMTNWWRMTDWLVVSTPLKNISQLGWFFPIYGQMKLMFQTTNQLNRSK